MSQTTAGTAQQPLSQFSDLSLRPAPSSPALPVELLLKIFRFALDDGQYSRRCYTKLACAQVNRLWRDASAVGVEYLVNGSEQTVALAAWLNSSGRGSTVRHLEIRVEAKEGTEGMAKLLGECRKINAFTLVIYPFVSTPSPFTVRNGFEMFRHALTVPLMELNELKILNINSGPFYMYHDFFTGILPSLQQLEHIEIVGQLVPRAMSVYFLDEDEDEYLERPMNALRSISLDGASASFANTLIGGSTKSLQKLSIKEMGMEHDSMYRTLRSLQEDLSEQLQVLELPDGEWTRYSSEPKVDILNIVSQHLTTLTSLTIGINCLAVNQLCSTLEKATALRHLSITCTGHSNKERLLDFSSSSTALYISKAPCLRTVVLPIALIRPSDEALAPWDYLNYKEVFEVADARNIMLKYK